MEASKLLVTRRISDIPSLGMCEKIAEEQLGNQMSHLHWKGILFLKPTFSHLKMDGWWLEDWMSIEKNSPPGNCWWNESLLKFHGLFQKTMTMTSLWSTWTPRVCLMTTFVHEPLINQFPSWNQICCTSELSHMFCHTVDGSNPANLLRLVVYPHTLKGFSIIPGG